MFAFPLHIEFACRCNCWGSGRKLILGDGGRGLLQKVGWGELWELLGLRDMLRVGLRGIEVFLLSLEWLGG